MERLLVVAFTVALALYTPIPRAVSAGSLLTPVETINGTVNGITVVPAQFVGDFEWILRDKNFQAPDYTSYFSGDGTLKYYVVKLPYMVVTHAQSVAITKEDGAFSLNVNTRLSEQKVSIIAGDKVIKELTLELLTLLGNQITLTRSFDDVLAMVTMPHDPPKVIRAMQHEDHGVSTKCYVPSCMKYNGWGWGGSDRQ